MTDINREKILEAFFGKFCDLIARSKGQKMIELGHFIFSTMIKQQDFKKKAKLLVFDKEASEIKKVDCEYKLQISEEIIGYRIKNSCFVLKKDKSEFGEEQIKKFLDGKIGSRAYFIGYDDTNEEESNFFSKCFLNEDEGIKIVDIINSEDFNHQEEINPNNNVFLKYVFNSIIDSGILKKEEIEENQDEVESTQDVKTECNKYIGIINSIQTFCEEVRSTTETDEFNELAYYLCDIAKAICFSFPVFLSRKTENPNKTMSLKIFDTFLFKNKYYTVSEGDEIYEVEFSKKEESGLNFVIKEIEDETLEEFVNSIITTNIEFMRYKIETTNSRDISKEDENTVIMNPYYLMFREDKKEFNNNKDNYFTEEIIEWFLDDVFKDNFESEVNYKDILPLISVSGGGPIVRSLLKNAEIIKNIKNEDSISYKLIQYMKKNIPIFLYAYGSYLMDVKLKKFLEVCGVNGIDDEDVESI